MSPSVNERERKKRNTASNYLQDVASTGNGNDGGGGVIDVAAFLFVVIKEGCSDYEHRSDAVGLLTRSPR